MHEEDSGLLHDCFSQFPFACGFGFPPDFNDDLVGRHLTTLTATDLTMLLPNVGDTIEQTFSLGECFDRDDIDVCAIGFPSGPEYRFTFRVTRLPDFVHDPVLQFTPGPLVN